MCNSSPHWSHWAVLLLLLLFGENIELITVFIQDV